MKRIGAICFVILFGAISSALWALPAQHPEPPEAGGTMRILLGGEHQAWLGVELEDVTAARVSELKLPGEYGAIVTRVMENSPAAKAGIHVNDVILDFAGMRVWSVAQLSQLVEETPPGRTVNLRISRAGHNMDLKVTLARREESLVIPRFRMPPINFPRSFNFHFGPARGRLGVRVENLTPQLADYFGVKQGKGVLITEVEPETPAAKAGLKAGDCIVKAGSKDIQSIMDLTEALDSAGAANQPVTLKIIRRGQEESFKVELEHPPQPLEEQQVRELQRRIRRQIRALASAKEVEALQSQLPTSAEMARLNEEIEALKKESNPQIENMKKQLEQMDKLLEAMRALERSLNSQVTRRVESV